MGKEAFMRQWPDAVKRCSDAVNMHALVGSWGKWVAIRLHDGGSDGVLYDSRADAVSHQITENFCTYFKVPPSGMPPQEADSVLRWARFCYDHGYRPTAWDDNVPIMPNQIQDLNRIIATGRK